MQENKSQCRHVTFLLVQQDWQTRGKRKKVWYMLPWRLHAHSQNRWIKCNDWWMVCPANHCSTTCCFPETSGLLGLTFLLPLALRSVLLLHHSFQPSLNSYHSGLAQWASDTSASTTNTQYTSRRKLLKRMHGAKNATDESERAESPFWYSASGRCCHTSLDRFRKRRKVLRDRFQDPKMSQCCNCALKKPDENGCIKVECLVVFIWYVWSLVCSSQEASISHN